MRNFGNPLGLITGSVGNMMDNDEEDVRKVRTGLENLDVIDEEEKELDFQGKPLGIITRGLDTGIKKFQRDNDLKEDGVLKPGGETEAALKDKLFAPSRKQETLMQKTAAAALPPLAFQLAMLLGMSATAAWQHYQSLPPSQKTELRNRVNKNESADEDDDEISDTSQDDIDKQKLYDECERKYKRDSERCRDKNLIRRADNRARCWERARIRYDLCIRGREEEEWPKLIYWN